jgi:hypothetical protein
MATNYHWQAWNATITDARGWTSGDGTCCIIVPTGNTITTATTTAVNYARSWITWNQRAEETQEQRAVRVRLAEEAKRVRDEAQAKAEATKRRARKLLVSCLDDTQRKSYAERGFFYLHTKSGRTYRIDQGTHGNVKLIDVTKNRVLGSYCVQPNGVPAEDAMLAQKLHLEADEAGFIRAANFRAAA